MNVHEVLFEIAERECQKICRKTIRTLQRMDSANHSDLENAWNELCVQAQGGESIYWEIYVDTVTRIIGGHLERVTDEIKQAMWLSTPNGLNWQGMDSEPAPYSEDDIVEHILHEYVLRAAADWTN